MEHHGVTGDQIALRQRCATDAQAAGRNLFGDDGLGLNGEAGGFLDESGATGGQRAEGCLLYTSDAADE